MNEEEDQIIREFTSNEEDHPVEETLDTLTQVLLNLSLSWRLVKKDPACREAERQTIRALLKDFSGENIGHVANGIIVSLRGWKWMARPGERSHQYETCKAQIMSVLSEFSSVARTARRSIQAVVTDLETMNKEEQENKEIRLKETTRDITGVCDQIRLMLIKKNKSYGDSALHPLNIFFRGDAESALRARIDDKLSRLIHGDENHFDEDAELDLMGYLVLLRIAKLRKRKEDRDVEPISKPIPKTHASALKPEDAGEDDEGGDDF